jgi:hypothetical protein
MGLKKRIRGFKEIIFYRLNIKHIRTKNLILFLEFFNHKKDLSHFMNDLHGNGN